MLRLTKNNFDQRFGFIRTLAAVIISLFLAFVIIFLVSAEPLDALGHFILGPFTNFRRFANVIELAVPLTFCGLALSIIFSANLMTIAVEGAFYLSCATTAVAAVLLDLPPVIHPIVCLLVGTLTGMLVIAIPATLKMKFDADELVSSIMLNYICLYMGMYLIRMTVLDTSLGITSSQPFRQTALLPRLIPSTRIHLGVIFVIVAIIAASVLINRSRLGYAIRVTGLNAMFARYSGIHVNKVVLAAQLIAGALAGFGGANEMIGMYNRFQYQGLTQYGFDGVIIAIIAKNNPAFVPVGALFLAYIRVGADIMNRSSDVPLEVISVIQAVIIMLIVANKFLGKLRNRALIRLSLGE